MKPFCPDQILIRDLEVHYCVGVFEEERAQPQRLLLSLTIDHSFSQAQESGELSQTIDYAAIALGLKHFGERRSWKLIECLANDIARWVINDFNAQRVAVEVKKFALQNAQYVSVKLARCQAKTQITKSKS